MNTSQLTFTRFIAAVSIVVFHFGKGVYPFNHGALSLLFNNANVAVSYFFNLSGFVMIIAYGSDDKKVDTRKYYVNRFAKIYPVYLLAFLVMLLYTIGPYLLKVAGEILLVQSAIPQFLPSYNLPDWSLSVEVFFYLLFPLIFNRFYLKYPLKTIMVWVMGFWLVSQVICYFLSAHLGDFTSQTVNYVYYNPFLHLNEFLTGNLAGLIFLYFQRSGRLSGDYPIMGFFILLALAFLAFPFLKNFRSALPVNFHNGLLVIVFSPFILLLALNRGRVTRFFSIPFLVYLGEISYCIYILQFPVYVTWGKLSGNTGNAFKTFYLPLLILLLVSALAYRFVEIPGKGFIRSKLSQKKKAVPA